MRTSRRVPREHPAPGALVTRVVAFPQSPTDAGLDADFLERATQDVMLAGSTSG